MAAVSGPALPAFNTSTSNFPLFNLPTSSAASASFVVSAMSVTMIWMLPRSEASFSNGPAVALLRIRAKTLLEGSAERAST
jgi:hypothetical protein